ncbi:MAG: hypothetical protein P8M80_04575 [Pirellulaceae bacterium]|nr:hypothetical protein [Pirellulaceae bacterium]
MRSYLFSARFQNTQQSRPRFAGAACLWMAVVILWSLPVTGRQEDAPGPPAAVGAPVPAMSKQDKEPSDDQIRERTIYIPFEKLRDVFEKNDRKVVLSYKEFNELWNAARKNARLPEEAESRQGSIISQADSRASIKDAVVLVDSTIRIELLSKGWHEVTLGLRNSVISSAKIGAEEARIIFSKETGYKLLAKNETDQPKTLELSLQYARQFIKSVGQSAVSFEAPQAPVNRWQIRIPQPKVKIDIEPLIAVSESGGDAETENTDPEKETVVYAFLGVAPVITLKWNPKSEGAAGLDAIVSAQTVQQVIIEKNVQRTQVQINYEISRAELTGFQIEVPVDQKVTNVFNDNVKKWNVETVDGKQAINVELFSPIQGLQTLTMELEKLTEEALKQDFSAPQINALNASRQQGVVVVRLAEGLRSIITNRLGLLQLDKSELPGQLKQINWDLAFRYASLPYQLEMRIEKILPRIIAEQLIEVEVTPQKISATLTIEYDIQKAGVFSTGIKVPIGYEVRSIVGRPGKNQIGVSEFRQDETEKTLWTVEFTQKAMGKTGMIVSIEKEVADANLLTPTGEASELELPVPGVSDSFIEYSSGNLVVYGPESLRINPELETGLQQVATVKAYEKISAGPRFKGGRSVLAYTYSGDRQELKVGVLRRRPQVTVRQLLSAKIESGVVKYDAKFFYEILYSGIKSIRIDLPESVATSARNLTQGVTESELDNADGLEGGYVGWSFSGETEWIGNRTIHLSWEEKINELEIGKSVDISLPRLIPRNVDRAQGQIVTSKSETIDIQPIEGVEGIVPIDPKVDLMSEARSPDAAAAFEFVDSWSLGIRATRYDVEDVKLTNVEAGLVQIVQLRQSGLNVQALFRIRSAVQRLGIKLPEGVDAKNAFDSQPVRINGNPVNLEIGTDDQLFIPLTGIKSDEPFLLDLRYKVDAEASRIVLPSFADEPAMQKVYLCVHVPQERAVIGSLGPWTNELLKNKSSWRVLTDRAINEYAGGDELRWRVDQIKQDIQNGVNDLNPSPEFNTDGRRYLFSSLRPGPEEELKVISISKVWLHSTVVILVFLVGLPLYRRPFTLQLSGLFFLIAIFVMSGVFFPMLARQILGSVLLISTGLVVLIWGIGHLRDISFNLSAAWKNRSVAVTPVSSNGHQETVAEVAGESSEPVSTDEDADNSKDPDENNESSENSGQGY